MRKKTLFIFLPVLFSGCHFWGSKKAALPYPTLEKKVLEKAQKGKEIEKNHTTTSDKSEDDQTRISAQVQAENSAAMAVDVSGTIDKIYAHPGDVVKKNQHVLRIKNDQLRLNFRRAQLNLQSRKMEQDAEKKQFETISNQYQAGIVSKNAVEMEKNKWENAKIAVKNAQVDFLSEKKNFQNATLTAPFGGVITQIKVSVGDSVNSGTVVANIVEQEHLIVHAQIPTTFYKNVQDKKELAYINPMTQQKGNISITKVIPVFHADSGTFDVYGKFMQGSPRSFPGAYIEILLDVPR